MIVLRYLRTSVLLGLVLFAMTASMAVASHHEIRNLVATIALYPDPLLAMILPASTYPDQVCAAADRDLGDNEDAIDRQDWDISVKELAHYPRLLRKLANAPDWLARLGQVYAAQPGDVMHAIQRLRQRARANGVLQNSPQERVYQNGYYIYIVPNQPDMIYYPEYNPEIVYADDHYANGQIYLSFGVGLTIGCWLSSDTDWGNHRVYNSGWQGSSWRANSRTHFTMDHYYIANSGHAAVLNRNVFRRHVNLGKVYSFKLPATRRAAPLQASARPSGYGVPHPQAMMRGNVNHATMPHVMANHPGMHQQVARTGHVTTGRPSVTRGNSGHSVSPASSHPAQHSAARSPAHQQRSGHQAQGSRAVQRGSAGHRSAGGHSAPAVHSGSGSHSDGGHGGSGGHSGGGHGGSGGHSRSGNKQHDKK